MGVAFAPYLFGGRKYFQNKGNRMAEIGDLVSAFVEERVDDPNRDEGEFWQEAVFAALFSVAFEATMRLPEIRMNPETLRQTVLTVVEEVVTTAAVWVNRRLSQSWPDCRITIDISNLMRSRLIICFNEAITVMGEKEWSLETARSHAAFSLLNQAATALIIKGVIPSQEAAKNFLQNGMEACDSMAGELAQELKRKSSQQGVSGDKLSRDRGSSATKPLRYPDEMSNTWPDNPEGIWNGLIELPPWKVQEVRGRVHASLTEGTRQEQQMAYRLIVADISHPEARFRGRCVRRTRELQYLLNLIMIVNLTMYGVFIGLGVVVSRWLFLGLPLWLVCDLGLLNRLQTWINCELATRLMALDELMNEDKEFRDRALAVLDELSGIERSEMI